MTKIFNTYLQVTNTCTSPQKTLIKKSQQSGFTLIELVIVIVILATLSATALSKFLDLATDARIETIQAMKGALSSTASLVYMKSNIDNVTDGFVKVNGNDVAVNDGYITGHWNNAWRYALEIGKDISFTQASEGCVLNDICGLGNQTGAPGLPITVNGNGLVLVWLNGMKLSDLCYAYYYNPSDGNEPTSGAIVSGC